MSITDWVGIVSLVAIVLVVVMLAACHYKWKHPKRWIIKGKAPPGMEEALEVLSWFGPRMVGGYIEWVPNSFVLNGQRVAGALIGTDPFRMELMYCEKIEESALAHEFEHAYQMSVYGRFTEPQDSEVVTTTIRMMNAAIAKELGR